MDTVFDALSSRYRTWSEQFLDQGTKRRLIARLGLLAVFLAGFLAWMDENKKATQESNRANQLQGQLSEQGKTVQDLQAKMKEAPKQEPLKIGFYSLGPVAIRQKEGVVSHEFILDTNQTINPVRLSMNCDGDIMEVTSRMLGTNAISWGGFERVNPRQYEIDLNIAWFPNAPLVVRVHTNQKEMKCAFVTR